MTTFAVLGSGGWGTAIALLLAQNPDHRVRLWSAHAGSARVLNEKRENSRLLPGVPIPATIVITADETEAVAGADCWVSAIPTAFLRSTLARFQRLSNPAIPIVSLTKGIEIATFRRPTEIIEEVLGTRNHAVLSGPSHAEEVARGMPTSVVLASADTRLAAWTQQRFGTERFRAYTNVDCVGVELAGALKNVLGIAAGICDGLKFGDNAKAALLTRGIVEMTRFGVAHGAEPATFTGLAGIGDLIATCFSPHGRNRRVGDRIGRGEPRADVLAGPQVAEGVATSRAVYERIQRLELEAPIMTAVYEVLHAGKPPQTAVQELLTREMKQERMA
ncbi:MAG TPA: NAD(P)H-dependent glycerol-3-phosphate dehydrogenase [Urbifossiella sp.]|nr:NAD(P)H-dependent glycerol-3-phosphate dehydrogenase [Urbifossiella sp.]